jgi:hypothetical protein
MLIRKSQIQSVIDKAKNIVAAKRDEYWQNTLDEEINKREYEHFIRLQEKEAEIQELSRTVTRLKDKIKTAEEKYYAGKAMIQKARQVAFSIEQEFSAYFDTQARQMQAFATLKSELLDSERKYLIENGK